MTVEHPAAHRRRATRDAVRHAARAPCARRTASLSLSDSGRESRTFGADSRCAPRGPAALQSRRSAGADRHPHRCPRPGGWPDSSASLRVDPPPRSGAAAGDASRRRRPGRGSRHPATAGGASDARPPSESSMPSRVSFVSSTVGTKVLIAITGLAMFVFLIGHLAGNLLLLVGPEAFNGYSHKLISNPGHLRRRSRPDRHPRPARLQGGAELGEQPLRPARRLPEEGRGPGTPAARRWRPRR